MEKIPRVVYTKELREQVVKLVMEGGEPVKTVAIRLSMPEGILKKRVTADINGNLAEIGKMQKPQTELARVRNELVETKVSIKPAPSVCNRRSVPK